MTVCAILWWLSRSSRIGVSLVFTVRSDHRQAFVIPPDWTTVS